MFLLLFKYILYYIVFLSFFPSFLFIFSFLGLPSLLVPLGLWHFALSVGVCSLADNNNNNDYDEAGPSSSFSPLKIKMLGLPRDLEWFAMGTVDDPLERLQRTPLGVILPPHRESQADH